MYLFRKIATICLYTALSCITILESSHASATESTEKKSPKKTVSKEQKSKTKKTADIRFIRYDQLLSGENQIKEIIDLQKQTEKEIKAIQAELDAQAKVFQKRYADLQEQEKALSKEAFNQMVAKLQEEERDFITNVVSPTQQQITLRSGQTYQKVLSIIEYGANKYREQEGFDFYCISPLEGNKEFDATQAIADLLNKEYDERQKADLKTKQTKLSEPAAAA